MAIKVLGCDPGMANFGYALIDVTSGQPVLDRAGVIRTAKSPKKQNRLVAEDNVQRTREILHGIFEFVFDQDVKVIAAERKSAPRNASASAKVSMVWGALIALAFCRSIPIVQPSPQEIKKSVCGKISASKAEVEVAMRKLFTPCHALEDLDASVTPSKREHAFDAMATVIASLDSDIMRAICIGAEK